MIRPWHDIAAHYASYDGDARSIQAIGELAQRINESHLANGLFAWTSIYDLCIVQTPVTYPYDGPLLRLTPVSATQIEFRYLDTFVHAKQWHRTVDAGKAWARLIKFLDQLRWFPAEVLGQLS